MVKYKKFRNYVVDQLKDIENARLFLETALEEYDEDRDIDAFKLALRYVAEAQGGITALAEKSGLNRQNLYKALSESGNPRLSTLGDIIHGLGFRLSIQVLPSHISKHR